MHLVVALVLAAQSRCALGVLSPDADAGPTPDTVAARPDADGSSGDTGPAPPGDTGSPPLDAALPTDAPAPPTDAPAPPMDAPAPPMDTGLPPGACVMTRDCATTPGRPVCDTAARRCVQCLAPGDCPTGQMCTAQTCVPACACTAGATRPCTASCGSPGTERCGADCRWSGTCGPPVETCNAVDDDCNGRCDDTGGCRTGVNRSYNRSSGEHFYTTSATEAVCCGFALEFANYYYLYSTAQPGTVPFYRCYLTAAGRHFYTTSASCEGAPSTTEGVLGHIASAPTCGSTPLYRLVHRTNGDHFYTVSAAERDAAVASGAYINEGIAGHVWAAPTG